MKTIIIIVLIIIGIVLFFGAIVIFFTYVLAKGLSLVTQQATDVNAVKILKGFLGLDFQGEYTVIKYEERPLHGDHPLYISISIPEESIKEIMTFLESVNFGSKTTYENDEKRGKIKCLDRWYKDKEKNIYGKTHDAFYVSDSGNNDMPFFRASLEIDCDNKTLSFSALSFC